MIVDHHGRRFRNLRVSLTAACNYACTYCVQDGRRLVAARDEMSPQLQIRAVALLIEAAGIEQLRITGGEPLISPGLDEFLSTVSTFGLSDISLTRNGQFLARKLQLLVAAGVKRLNISLDTLDAATFRNIARGGDLASVLNGLDLAKETGMLIKINMVPLRGANHEQILPMLDYCLERGFELRYIELMRMGHLSQRGTAFVQQFLGMSELLETIGKRYNFTQVDAPLDSTAVRYKIEKLGFFGIIANESMPFCRTCSRLRLTSAGWLHGCLSSNTRHYIGDLLDMPNELALPALQRMLVAAMADKQDSTFTGALIPMKAIGG